MQSQRSLLIVGLIFVSFLLWQQWQIDYSQQPVTPPNLITENQSGVDLHNDVPAGQDVPTSTVVNNSEPLIDSATIIRVSTDTLELLINTKGGDIISANLNDFSVTLGSEEKFSLLRPNQAELYIAQSGLIGADGPDANKNGRPVYHATAQSYVLKGEELIVPLTWQSDDGLSITKKFIFHAGKHNIEVRYDIQNNSQAPANMQQYAQLKQAVAGKEGGGMFMPTYRGSAFSTDETNYEKYTFDDISEANLRKVTQGGWVAMLEHYFVSAWIPPEQQQNTIFSKSNNNGVFATIGYIGQPLVIEPGQHSSIHSELYLGPKNQDALEHLAKGLDLTVDYGILWWISQPLFALLKFIQSFVGNWGVAIIIITIIVKGAMYPLTKAQYVSMGKMRALQPKMAALKERYGDDKQKMSKGMMELYKKEKVNPMGGCFPLLLQMPIFLALYYVFLESVEFRHADFFLWINDLSVQDPYYVLPVLMGASMFLLQKLNPATVQDPMQQKIMQFMPVVMTVFFLWFPAGLVLYWLVSNLITITQAKIIYAGMEKKGMKIK